MFFVVVSCVWFGTSNAAREIVTERAIYLRERMVNLRLFNYVLSKYILLELLLRRPVHDAARRSSSSRSASTGGPMAFLIELGNAHRRSR